MPYIGMFTEAAIQKAIDRAGSKLADGQSGLVVHLDNQGELSASIIQRMGDHISVEGAAALDTSKGFKFDKDHLKIQAELVAKW